MDTKKLQEMMKRAAETKAQAAGLGNVGRYRLLSLVGEGGHGRVYRAAAEPSGQIVAVKVLHEHVDNSEIQMRLKREAYAMAQLAGTHAARVYECDQTSAGQVYIVMELLDGQDLETLVTAHEAQGQLLPVRAMVQILDPIVHTLEVAHARGIIHRDLKPQNIFVTRDGSPRLVDFGLMKDLSLAQLTAVGTVAGSPGYIAPESWGGDPSLVSHRIDVYALGVMAFRILTGRKPFEPGDDLLAFVLAVTTSPRPSLAALRPDLRPSLDAWVERALAVRPHERFGSVTELWTALRAELGV